jgi:hypothetical protein
MHYTCHNLGDDRIANNAYAVVAQHIGVDAIKRLSSPTLSVTRQPGRDDLLCVTVNGTLPRDAWDAISGVSDWWNDLGIKDNMYVLVREPETASEFGKPLSYVMVLRIGALDDSVSALSIIDSDFIDLTHLHANKVMAQVEERRERKPQADPMIADICAAIGRALVCGYWARA